MFYRCIFDGKGFPKIAHIDVAAKNKKDAAGIAAGMVPEKLKSLGKITSVFRIDSLVDVESWVWL